MIFHSYPARCFLTIQNGQQQQYIWLAPRDDLVSARPLTQDNGASIRSCSWSHNRIYILYSQDKNGDENSHLYTVELEAGKVRDLTPFDSVMAYFIARSQKHPDEIIAGLNHRNLKWHDIYRINVVNGERTLLLENERFRNVIVDNEPQLRFAIEAVADGGSTHYQLFDGEWQQWLKVPPEDILTTNLIGFDNSNGLTFNCR